MSNNIPVIKVDEDNLPTAWENSVLETWKNGINIKTEYDNEKDNLSQDCTMIMVIKSPFSEPRIHRAFPGGLEDLEIYRQEVVDGIHDDWIDPEEGKWTYTYHQRLCEFEGREDKVDQIEYIVNKLVSNYYTRRAQAITWDPGFDPNTDDPPCLQRIWCRITKKNKSYYLNMNTHWRSRDAYKAAFMNMFAFTDLQKCIADKISEKIENEVKLGRYVDISDSYHIYGAYLKEVKSFTDIVKKRSFEDRTWETEFAQPFFNEANPD